MPVLLSLVLSFGLGAALSWGATRMSNRRQLAKAALDARMAFAEELESDFI